MRDFCLALLFLASAQFVFGQLESDTLTIQSSRSTILQPDQLVFNVSLTSTLDATLDQVVASLPGSGITAADLSGVFSSLGNPFLTSGPGLLWSFTLGVPLTKLKGTVASLTMLQSSIAKNNSGAALMFQVQGSRVSSELTQAQSCSLQSLVADAQAQAQKLAVAAGLYLGPILAISDGSSGGVSSQDVLRLLPGALEIGAISTLPLIAFVQPISISASTPFTCIAEVKFKLLH